eukprot:1159724-Pelagomonas_calceolata.AAC.3
MAQWCSDVLWRNGAVMFHGTMCCAGNPSAAGAAFSAAQQVPASVHTQLSGGDSHLNSSNSSSSSSNKSSGGASYKYGQSSYMHMAGAGAAGAANDAALEVAYTRAAPAAAASAFGTPRKALHKPNPQSVPQSSPRSLDSVKSTPEQVGLSTVTSSGGEGTFTQESQHTKDTTTAPQQLQHATDVAQPTTPATASPQQLQHATGVTQPTAPATADPQQLPQPDRLPAEPQLLHALAVHHLRHGRRAEAEQALVMMEALDGKGAKAILHAATSGKDRRARLATGKY